MQNYAKAHQSIDRLQGEYDDAVINVREGIVALAQKIKAAEALEGHLLENGREASDASEFGELADLLALYIKDAPVAVAPHKIAAE